MSFQILPAEPADAHDMAVVFWDAFISDPIFGSMGMSVPMKELYAYSERRYQRGFANAALEGMRFTKVVDLDCGKKMVAFAKWQYPRSLTDEQQGEMRRRTEGNPFGDDAPDGYNIKLSDDFFEKINEKHQKWVNDDKDYVLHILSVSPQYQRKGIGSLLIAEGLALADRDSARTYIEASPVGLHLYLRHGWKLIDEIYIDMASYGCEGRSISVDAVPDERSSWGLPLLQRTLLFLMTFCEALNASMDGFIDDESTLVPDDRTEHTLVSESDLTTSSSCHFLGLPVEVRKKIYRYFCLSDIDLHSHPRLWAPMRHESSWRSTAYFERNTVLPILLTCWQMHNDASAVLYGENLFAFHISVVSQGPVLFFEWLAPQYVRLLRKVYFRTGFNVDTYDFDCDEGTIKRYGRHHASTLLDFQAAKDLSVSAALIKQAWPSKYGVRVNKETVLWFSKKDEGAMWTNAKVNNWPKGAFYLWKMIVDKEHGDDSGSDFRPEFRRVLWVEDLASNDLLLSV